MVIEVISLVISIISLLISVVLVILKYKEFKSSQPKLKIDLKSQAWNFRARKKEEEKDTSYFSNDSTSYHVPSKILIFDLTFDLENQGEKAIGVKDIVIRWIYPEFDLKIDKNPLEYNLLENIRDRFGVFGSQKNNSFILEGNQIKRIILKLETPIYVSVNLDKNKLLYEKRFKEKYKNIDIYSELPPKIILQILVYDIRGNFVTEDVPFVLS